MLPIENSFIFPGLDKYSVLPVLEQADERSIVILSGVNREACQFLSNEVYFKQRVAFAFPKYMATGFTFPTLCETHPINCWKLLSCSSGEGVLALNETFLKARIPFFCRELESKKAHAEEQIRVICGSRYEDPDSPIHQLWLEFEKANSDMHKMKEDLENDEHLSASRTMFLGHKGYLLSDVLWFLNSHSGLLAQGKEEEFFAEAYSRQVPLRQDLLSCYRYWSCFYKKDLEAINRQRKCYNDYQVVENRRLSYCDTQQACNDEIAELQDPLRWMWSNCMGRHQLNLSSEFDIATAAEKLLEAAASCIHLIDQVEKGQLKPTPEVCKQILDIICSPLSARLQWYLWGKLFQIEAVEQSFHTEKRQELFIERFNASFPQCLPQLRSILSSIPQEVLVGNRLY
jgi:hypothetical protein